MSLSDALGVTVVLVSVIFILMNVKTIRLNIRPQYKWMRMLAIITGIYIICTYGAGLFHLHKNNSAYAFSLLFILIIDSAYVYFINTRE
jgi:hypothetical protein